MHVPRRPKHDGLKGGFPHIEEKGTIPSRESERAARPWIQPRDDFDLQRLQWRPCAQISQANFHPTVGIRKANTIFARGLAWNARSVDGYSMVSVGRKISGHARYTVALLAYQLEHWLSRACRLR